MRQGDLNEKYRTGDDELLPILSNTSANCVPAEEDDNRVRLCRNESQEEDVTTATVVALEDGFTKRALCMKCDFLMLGSDQVIDDMSSRRVACTPPDKTEKESAYKV